jgi:DNA-binding transcriptional MocR family regulator
MGAQMLQQPSVLVTSNADCVCCALLTQVENAAMNNVTDPGLRDAIPLYQTVASEIERAMAVGSLRVGDRLPSVRQLCSQHGVSVSTATLAYRTLENRGLVEARPKSGYFVAACKTVLPEPELDVRMGHADFVEPSDLRLEFLYGADDPFALPALYPAPARSLLPESKLRQLTARANRLHPEYATRPNSLGSGALRQALARRAVHAGVSLRPEEILLTNGGTSAIFLALRCVAQAGDTIALESPTYYMLLEIIKGLGMKSLEIPTHPRHGISLEALDFATRTTGAVKACVVIPNFHNPLGSLIPKQNKKQLVALAAQRGFTLIETDIYGETYFGDERPPVLKSFDATDAVILCSAFTKTVAPGMRVGWMAPGRHFKAAESLRMQAAAISPLLQQEVMAEFLCNGGYDHHLRRLRAALKAQSQQLSGAVTRYFPPGCKLSRPQGGLMLWIELPAQVDSRRLYDQARREHIGMAPGASFSCSQRYNHFIRLHHGEPWTSQLEANIKRLGQLVAQQLQL